MFWVGTCPQCLKSHLALSVVAITPSEADYLLNLYLRCPNCKLPSCLTAYNPHQHSPSILIQANDNLESHDLNIRQVWPEMPAPNLPEAIPEGVKSSLVQAESNFSLKHNEAAAVMYRRALELGLKEIGPELKGTLASRITQLGKNGKLTDDLVNWANEIRELGNDGAHDPQPVERSELESLRGLTEMVLKYLFTLPNLVAEKRKLKLEVADQ